MSDNIPDELVMEILGRLPVRTLLRFRCVCKSWCSLISSENFVTFWFNQTKRSVNNMNNLLLKHYTLHDKPHKQEHFSLHLDDESFTEYPLNKGSRPVARFDHLTVVGSCNGMVCVAEDHTLYLWNPSVRKFVVLPRPLKILHNKLYYVLALGLGFDSTTNDYKVVRIVYLSGGYLSVDREVDIYSLKEGGWRRISAISGSCWVPRIDCEKSQAYLNGAIHWVTGWSHNSFIVLFNLSTEVFYKIELPTSLGHIREAHSLSLGVFQDSLCVFQSDT
ncbi:putative F-box protein At3g16210 [Cornus florida]|uniref:putative F-box protein At3g16210 n=1 Tax=Cornus florida TaxID=4283 RepID=UPI002899D0AD|nr:putative F-box protein At3g16210 [Cornus florida]